MHADPQVRREYLKRYAESAKGQAARARAQERRMDKRRATRPEREATPDAKPLAAALSNWRAR